MSKQIVEVIKNRMTTDEIKYFMESRTEHLGTNWIKSFDGKTLDDIIGQGIVSLRFTNQELDLKVNFKEVKDINFFK